MGCDIMTVMPESVSCLRISSIMWACFGSSAEKVHPESKVPAPLPGISAMETLFSVHPLKSEWVCPEKGDGWKVSQICVTHDCGQCFVNPQIKWSKGNFAENTFAQKSWLSGSWKTIPTFFSGKVSRFPRVVERLYPSYKNWPEVGL